MSTCTHPTMTNHHAASLFSEAAEVLQVWRDRYVQRRELTQWRERDVRDAGLSPGDVTFEAAKPFWRA